MLVFLVWLLWTMWPWGTQQDGHVVLIEATGLIWILKSGKCQDAAEYGGDRNGRRGERKREAKGGGFWVRENVSISGEQRYVVRLLFMSAVETTEHTACSGRLMNELLLSSRLKESRRAKPMSPAKMHAPPAAVFFALFQHLWPCRSDVKCGRVRPLMVIDVQ